METKYFQKEGLGLPINNGAFRPLSNNLRVWTGFENGASLEANWQGEKDVAILGYDTNPVVSNSPPTTSGIRMARFQAKRNLQVTASGICSPVPLRSSGALPLTDIGYRLDNGALKNTLGIQNDFNSNGGLVGVSQPKPSKLQLVIGVYFIHDRTYYGSHAFNRGVARGGVGTGDYVYVENLNTGSIFHHPVNHNVLRTDGAHLRQSVDWAGNTDTEGFVAGTKHRVTWLQMLTEKNDEWRISIRATGWADTPSPTPSTQWFPANNHYYYTAVYLIEGCGLGLDIVEGEMSIGGADKSHSRDGKGFQYESTGLDLSDGVSIV